ncbi:MAG: NtrZ family periplasmic regulatory protein [Pseudomonadota bacterium]
MRGTSVICGFLMLATPIAFADEAMVTAPEPLDLVDAGNVSLNEAPAWYQQFTVTDPGFVTPEAALEGYTQKDLKLQWLKTGRWELTLDLTSRNDLSALPREEMAAGATFQITPRISVGGDLSVGAQELDDQSEWENQDIEAGIRLRSAFRF